MSTVASVDYATKRIYLSAATVGATLDLTQVYRDTRALRAATPLHQKYKPFLVAGGNLQKTATTFTQPYVQLLYGGYIVPYNAAQILVIVREVFSDDGRSGVACFDRATLTHLVDIDMQVAPVEVRLVNTGGSTGPTTAEIASAVWALANGSPTPGSTGDQLKNALSTSNFLALK